MVLDDAGENPKKIVVVGGGRTGEAILDLLTKDTRFDPYVLETDYDRLRFLRDLGYVGEQISGTETLELKSVLKDATAVICAAPPSVSPRVANAAKEAGCHYIDLCEDAAAVGKVVALAADSDLYFVPGCGLAPGLVSTLTDQMVRAATQQAEITAYVGVLPATKTNRLGFGDLWNIDGLMAEYTNPCRALVAGEIVAEPALQQLEELTIAGTEYEAFSTSGGLDDLVKHYRGTVQALSFKTIRYPGHLDYIRFLLDDLKLSDRLYLLRNLLLNGLTKGEEDKVVIRITDRNTENSRELNLVFRAKPLSGGRYRSAVANVSAHHVCAVLDILTSGLAPHGGVLHHSDLTLEILNQSRYSELFSSSE